MTRFDVALLAGALAVWIAPPVITYAVMDHRASQAQVTLTEQLAIASDERDVDHGVLQLLYEGSYDREAIQMTDVTVSAYSSAREQTDSTPHTTASGANTMVGQIAVSRDLINRGVHFGSIVYLEGLGLFRVEDVMAPRWTERVDIWCSDKRACTLFGVKSATMIWMEAARPEEE